MSPLTRLLLTAFTVITVFIGAGIYLSVRDEDASAATQSEVTDAGQVVRENSHRLNDVPDSAVTFVEFLDFECEDAGLRSRWWNNCDPSTAIESTS